MPEAETYIDLIRHGEPAGGSRFRGGVDDPLSERGWQQMCAAVGDHSGWQQIVTSPLQRCLAFAETLGRERDLPVESEIRFREVGFGCWEGCTRAELEARDPGQVERFFRDPVRHRPAGAEPLDAFIARVAAGFHDMLERHAGRRLLVVAHAGVIRAMLTTVLDIPPVSMYRIHVANAGVTRLRTDRQRGFALLQHG